MEDKEIPQLQKLYERGIQNGVKGLTMVDKKGIKEIEPHCQVQVGYKALGHLEKERLGWYLKKIKCRGVQNRLTLSLPRVIKFNFLSQSFRDISYSLENLAIDSLLR